MNELELIIKPDEDDPEAAEVLVDGTVGGQPYRFLLDTGAARSSLKFDAYTATFETIEKRSSSGVFARSSDDLITVPLIELGPISKQNFSLVRTAENAPDLRNLIGMDLLKDFCCHFFFDENRVRLETNPETKADYTFQELFLDSKFHPYVAVQFGTAQAKAVWDTGAGITIVDLNFIKEHSAFFEEAGHSVGTDATGFKVDTPMFSMAATLIGQNTFPPHKVAGVDLAQVNTTVEVPMDLILGYSTLSKANWLFDFPRRRWTLSKIPG